MLQERRIATLIVTSFVVLGSPVAADYSSYYPNEMDASDRVKIAIARAMAERSGTVERNVVTVEEYFTPGGVRDTGLTCNAASITVENSAIGAINGDNTIVAENVTAACIGR